MVRFLLRINLHFPRLESGKEKATMAPPVLSTMGDIRQIQSGRKGVVSERDHAQGSRNFPISRKGYQGKQESLGAHFAATSDRWKKEDVGEAPITTTATIDGEYGNYSQWGNIYYPESSGGAKG